MFAIRNWCLSEADGGEVGVEAGEDGQQVEMLLHNGLPWLAAG
jgi:hypothetical protein